MGSIGVVELDLIARVAKLHAKDHFPLSASSQYLHTFIHFL